MSVTLACTWNPRGEHFRLQAMLPVLQSATRAIHVVLPPFAGEVAAEGLQEAGVNVVVSPEWPWGRHLALHTALESDADYILYIDMDRLLRWVETHPGEWLRTLKAVQTADCLVIGRTESAYRTHPRALVETERISNLVFSRLLGQTLDLSAGAKGFSRPAAEYLIQTSKPGSALGTDSEWPVLLHQAGFRLATIFVDGLEWESADRYRQQRAEREVQREAAMAYDLDGENWAQRVAVALEIVQVGLQAWKRIG